jgi:DNA ligase D-like protein (predicted 3'-phosphoesterase)
MSLKEYKAKRDFAETPEPKEGNRKPVRGKSRGLIYLIQEHHASRHHYDLRLEAKEDDEMVLKSWAIPKEPPLEEGIKRLAVQTEDHPLSYKNFKGTIPKGTYGAGTVKIWDRGTYLLIEKDAAKWLVRIRGRKLKGTYALIKLKSKNPQDKNWLLFKHKEPPVAECGSGGRKR